jgi:hypothetical protein
MKQTFYVLLCAFGLLPNTIFGRENDSLQNHFAEGLSLISGLSYCSIKDEFISNEKYSGSSMNYLFRWSKFHESYMYDLRMEVISSAKVKNNTISANVTDFNLNLTYGYPVGTVDVFGKQMNFFIGPYPELYFHYRSQNIASGGAAIIDAYSVAFLFSLGAKAYAYLPLNEEILFSGELSTNLISLGGKFIDPRDKENSMIKLLTVFAGTRFSTQYAVTYKLSDFLSVGGGYRFNVTRITAWDSLIFASDNFFLSATMKF